MAEYATSSSEAGRGNPAHGWLWMVAAAMLVLGLAYILYSRTRPSPDEGKLKAHPVLHLETFVVNLANLDERAYLRAGIDLGTSGPAPEDQAALARLRDIILTQLAQQRSQDILTAEGKERLKLELLTALQRQAPDLGVAEVYFTEFLVQR
jgi:flagellar basal body-associated protein FliL